MKYLTREWYVKARLAYLDSMVLCSKSAERFDESFYQFVYNKKLKRFNENERLRDEFRAPKDILKDYDDWINEPDISKEEKELRTVHKQITVIIDKERFETGKYYQYDEVLARKMFDVDLSWRVELVSHLPDYILKEVADVRVFALGYVGERVKTLLKDYCKQLRGECKKILNKAQIETDKVERMLSKRIMVNEYSELMLRRIYQKEGNVFLVFDAGTLKVVNATILQREEKRIYHYKRKEPYSSWSMVMLAELSYDDGLFRLHLLVDNKDKIGRSKYWYLTIQGTSIVECKGSKLSYVLDLLNVEYEDN